MIAEPSHIVERKGPTFLYRFIVLGWALNPFYSIPTSSFSSSLKALSLCPPPCGAWSSSFSNKLGAWNQKARKVDIYREKVNNLPYLPTEGDPENRFIASNNKKESGRNWSSACSYLSKKLTLYFLLKER